MDGWMDGSTYLSIYPSIYLSIYLSIHPSIHPSILSMDIYLSIHPSIHPIYQVTSVISLTQCSTAWSVGVARQHSLERKPLQPSAEESRSCTLLTKEELYRHALEVLEEARLTLTPWP